jgi:pyruvate ferredoxin oxidoreductase gamma subunit
MLEVRIHGRGGQGVVTAAELLSVSAFKEGRHAQAFPSFGSERMGAPVVSFCRIDRAPIRLREPIAKPDVVIVQDPTILLSVDVFAGLAAEGYVLINSQKPLAALGLGEWAERLGPAHVRCVPATELARKLVGRPLPNAALLGGFAALVGAVELASVCAAIRERFPGVVGERNVEAATAAFHETRALAGTEATC